MVKKQRRGFSRERFLSILGGDTAAIDFARRLLLAGEKPIPRENADPGPIP
jgi:hypothetical protein